MFEQLTIAAAKTANVAKTAAAKPAKKTAAAPAAGKTTAAKKTAAAPAKVATVAKPAAAKKGATKPAAAAIKFAIVDFARPTAGAALAAHTSAFLEMSGMFDGAAVPKATAAKVIGARAISYHSGNGNMEQTADGLMLTAKGVASFTSRTVDAEKVKAFKAFFADGAINDAINVKAADRAVKL